MHFLFLFWSSLFLLIVCDTKSPLKDGSIDGWRSSKMTHTQPPVRFLWDRLCRCHWMLRWEMLLVGALSPIDKLRWWGNVRSLTQKLFGNPQTRTYTYTSLAGLWVTFPYFPSLLAGFFFLLLRAWMMQQPLFYPSATLSSLFRWRNAYWKRFQHDNTATTDPNVFYWPNRSPSAALAYGKRTRKREEDGEKYIHPPFVYMMIEKREREDDVLDLYLDGGLLNVTCWR